MDESTPTPQNSSGSASSPLTLVTPTQKFPAGLILILILTGLTIVISLAMLTEPKFTFGAAVVAGPVAIVYLLVCLGASVAMFLGLLKRLEWARILAIVYSVHCVLYSTVDFGALIANPYVAVEAMSQVAPGLPAISLIIIQVLSVMLGWAVGASVILYLVLKKHYFGQMSTYQ